MPGLSAGVIEMPVEGPADLDEPRQSRPGGPLELQAQGDADVVVVHLVEFAGTTVPASLPRRIVQASPP